MRITKSPSHRDIKTLINKVGANNKENQMNNQNKPLFSTNNLQLRNQSIEWLYRAQYNLKFSRSTLFLAIGLIDQLLSKNIYFLEENQQILTAAVLLLSIKFNEVHPPTFKKLNCLCADEYSLSQFQEIQAKILQKLNFTIYPDQIYGELAEFQAKYEGKTPQIVKETIKTALLHPNEIFKYGKLYFIQGIKSYLNGGVFERCSNRVNATMEVFQIRKQLIRLRSANHKRLVSPQKY